MEENMTSDELQEAYEAHIEQQYLKDTEADRLN